MVADHGEKLDRGHLERDGDVLIGIDHDDIVLFIDRVEVGAAVVGVYVDIFRHREVLFRQVGDLLIDLDTLDPERSGSAAKILVALRRVSAGPVAEDQDFKGIRRIAIPAGFVLIDPRHVRRGHRVIIIHPGQILVLAQDRLHAEEHIGRQDDRAGRFLDLQIIIDGLSFIRQIALPERETALAAEQAAPQEQRQPCSCRLLAAARADEVHERKEQQDAGEQQERDRRPHRRDGHKGRQEGAQNAADGVARTERSDHAAVVVEAVRRVLDQRRGHRPEQEAREHEQHHAGRKARDDEEVMADREDQHRGDPEDDVLADHGDHGDPHRRDEDAHV